MALIASIAGADFDSTLELPTSGDPRHNATLTLTVRYRLVFADSKNRAGIVVTVEGTPRARDGTGFRHYILDWDGPTRLKFTKALWRAERIWSFKFLLVPPMRYDGLDLPHPHAGWKFRPNVLCAFRFAPDDKPHITVTAVRADGAMAGAFTSHAARATPRDIVLEYNDPWRPTLGHELGHVLGMLHILALKGDKACLTDHNAERCYGEKESEKANIMGSGQALWPLNALPWRERIAAHTGVPADQWTVSMDTTRAPTVIGNGSSLIDI